MENISWDGKLLIVDTDAHNSLVETNALPGTVAAYGYTIVLQGWITMRYNGREVHYTKDDLIIYTPGIVVSVIDISDDYRGICLVADKDFAFESPTMRDALLRLTTLHHTALSLTDCSRGFWPHCRRLHQPNASDRGLLHAEADFIPHRPDSRSPAFL